jgi:chemotaxis protein MotB
MGAKVKEKEDMGVSTNGWMTTFSDLCTLLLTFFVLLFSMSSMDDQRLKIAFQNFGGSSGILSFRDYREISRPMEMLIDGIYKSLGEKVVFHNMANLLKAAEDTRDFETLGNFLVVQPLSDGLQLAFGNNLLFLPGSIDLREEAIPVLEKIARFISISGYQAYIDGHTDNTPVNKEQYQSNEELSIARAFSVRNYLFQLENIPSESIALIGYGDIKPSASNDLPDGRAKNRRVEIILKNQRYF